MLARWKKHWSRAFSLTKRSIDAWPTSERLKTSLTCKFIARWFWMSHRQWLIDTTIVGKLGEYYVIVYSQRDECEYVIGIVTLDLVSCCLIATSVVQSLWDSYGWKWKIYVQYVPFILTATAKEICKIPFIQGLEGIRVQGVHSIHAGAMWRVPKQIWGTHTSPRSSVTSGFRVCGTISAGCFWRPLGFCGWPRLGYHLSPCKPIQITSSYIVA